MVSVQKAQDFDANSLCDEGMARLKDRDWQGAIDAFNSALQYDGINWEIHYGLGIANQETDQIETALLCFQRTLRLNIDHVDAHVRLGKCYSALNDGVAAITIYREALRLAPNNAEARFWYGAELNKRGHWRYAIAELEKAIELDPAMACAHSDLGVAFTHGQYFEKALECHRQALELAPDWADMHNNYGLTLLQQQKMDEAKAAFETAIKLDSKCHSAIMNLSSVYLYAGDLAGAWPTFNLRRRNNLTKYVDRFWQGETIPGKRLLVHAGDGLGDTLQMVRFLPQVKSLGAYVILEIQDSLLPLIKNCEGYDEIRGLSEHRDDYELQVSIFELPFVLKYSYDTLPSDTSYLKTDLGLVFYWSKKLRKDNGFKIGVNWRGNPKVKAGLHRSCRLKDFAPIAEIPNVKLYSLQKGRGKLEIEEFNKTHSITDFGEELDQAHGPFMDTAAIMVNMDLIITIDTSICHLAGGLGRPTWIALPLRVDWRWLLNRTDTPWYPTVQLFRQERAGDWSQVFNEMADALTKQLNASY